MSLESVLNQNKYLSLSSNWRATTVVNFNEITDEELIPLILGDQENFSYLVRRYEEKLTRYIRRIAGLDKEDIEDVLQEIFIKTYQNLNGFDTKLKFSSWIYRIAHNHVISNFRKTKARPVTLSLDEDENIARQIASSIDILKEVDQKLNAKVVAKVLARMDKKYKEILILKFLEEKDYTEISDILQKPIGTVGTLINRAKKEFRKIAEKERIKF